MRKQSVPTDEGAAAATTVVLKPTKHRHYHRTLLLPDDIHTDHQSGALHVDSEEALSGRRLATLVRRVRLRDSRQTYFFPYCRRRRRARTFQGPPSLALDSVGRPFSPKRTQGKRGKSVPKQRTHANTRPVSPRRWAVNANGVGTATEIVS